jgi:hypothetical protein
MITSYHTQLATNDLATGITSFIVTTFNDIADKLKINNTKILHRSDLNDNSTYSSATYMPFGGQVSYTRIYYDFINDFANFNCGVVIGKNGSMYGAYMARSELNGSTVTDTECSTRTTIIRPSTVSIYNMINKPYYIYNSQTLAYFAIGHVSHGIVFAKLKSIDDPLVTKPVIISFGFTSSSASDCTLGVADIITVLDSPSLQVAAYTSNINSSIDGADMMRISKFIYNGYYSDEIFVFDGMTPSGIFTLDNNTYVNLAHNVYLKVS